MHRLAIATCAAIIVLSAPWLAVPAVADQPIFVTVAIDREKVLTASLHQCDFPIVVREEGTWDPSFHVGPDGTVREIRHAQLTMTFTNQLTGASVSALQIRGLNNRYDMAPPVFHPDGSVTFTDEFIGAFQRVILPGVGNIGGTSGQLLTTHTFSADFALRASEAVVIAGHDREFSERLCDALT